MYPISLTHGGKITFTGSAAQDTSIRFLFENAPYPNNTPNHPTGNVTITTSNPTAYSVAIPAYTADANQTFSSFIMYVNERDKGVTLTDFAIEAYDSADTTAPVITVAGDTEVTLQVGATYTDAGATAVDDRDGTITVVTTGANVDTSTPGTYTVTYTVGDLAGNQAQATRTVTVQAAGPLFTGAFAGATKVGDVYTFPSGADAWAGFANDNADLYPISLTHGGKITFTGSAAQDTSIRFLFENAPYPNNNPNHATGNVTITTSNPTAYSVAIPAYTADANQTFSSFIMYVNERDKGVTLTDFAIEAYDSADTTAPVITVAGDTEVTLQVGATYTDAGATAVDDRDGTITVVTTGANVDTSTPGTYTVTYTVGDLAGNQAQATRTVTVQAAGPLFTGAFAGATKVGDVYTFPSGADAWAGFANDNADLYPISLTHGGKITFTGSAAQDTSIRFLFENAPYPNNTPNHPTGNVTITTSNPTAYSVAIPAYTADANQTFSSFIMYVNERDKGVTLTDFAIEAYDSADTTAPVITVAGDTEVTLQVGATYTDAGATAVDDRDGTITVVTTGANVDTSTPGTYTVTYTVGDLAGNQAQATRTVTVQAAGPLFTGAFAGATKVGDVYTFPSGADAWAGFANDNADLYPISLTHGGKITFTGSAAQDTSIRFLFENAPYPNNTPNHPTGNVTITTSNPTAYSVAIPAYTADANQTFSSFIMYVNERDKGVTLTDFAIEAYDSADTTAPVITVAGDAQVTLQVGATYTDAGATAVDDRDGTITVVTTGANVDTSTPGTYTVTYTVGDLAGNQAQATRTVTVQAAGPLFTGAFAGATKVGDVYTFPSGADAWAGFANDNADLYPISLTHGGKITFTGSAAQDTSIRFLFENAPYPNNTPNHPTGNVTITTSNPTAYSVAIPAYTADANQTFSSFIMYVNERDKGVTLTDFAIEAYDSADTTAPVITVAGDAQVTLQVGATYTDAGATAVDDRDGTITVVTTGANVDTSTPGTYTVTYTVGDLAGNQAQATRTVTVQAAGPLFTGAFAGATKVGDVYTFPSGADAWAGFANDNADLYPISLTYGGRITFTGSAAQDTSIRFLFENAPYPNNNPNHSTANIIIDSSNPTQYSLAIPAYTADANQTFSSFIMYVNERDQGVTLTDFQITTYQSQQEADDALAARLIYSDEFNVAGSPDTNKWHHQVIPPNNGTWHNGELQHYTDADSNSFVSNGTLKIVAKKENYTYQNSTLEYTSARLNSKFVFKYGRVEVRAKTPDGAGTWPAIWTLGANINEIGNYHGDTYGSVGWPHCGELDIMEQYGTDKTKTTSAIHWNQIGGSHLYDTDETPISNIGSDFHVYSMEWSP